MSLEPVYPVSVPYCVDAEMLESAVYCGMIEGCRDVYKLKVQICASILTKRLKSPERLLPKPTSQQWYRQNCAW